MATNTASAENFGENHFFYEDEVLKFDKNGRVKFGLVLESYEVGFFFGLQKQGGNKGCEMMVCAFILSVRIHPLNSH